MIINKEKCIGCGTCLGVCPVEAISMGDDGKAFIDQATCLKCGACASVCPVEAIEED